MTSRGTKRGAVSDSAFAATESNDLPSVQAKRFVSEPAGLSPEVQKTDSFGQSSLTGAPGIDPQRVELAHKNVKALNTQFVSWVQSQLQNHPDELWEDGVKDYLNHASDVKEKFSDVVTWLREKSSEAKWTSMVGLSTTEKKSSEGTENSKPIMPLQMQSRTGFGAATSIFSNMEAKGSLSVSLASNEKNPFGGMENLISKPSSPFQMQSGPGQNVTVSGFPTSWGSGISFGGGQPPFSLGIQAANPFKSETTDDLGEENDVEKPSSPSLKKTEEEGITVVHEVKCKVYLKPDNPADKGWKDMGMGMLSIKCKEGAAKSTKESRPTIIIRNDVGRILLNALLYPGIKTNIQKNTITSIFHTSSGGDVGGDEDKSEAAVPRTYLLKAKSEEEIIKLEEAIKEYAPTA